MKAGIENSLPEGFNSAPSVRTIPTSTRVLLWVCLGAWAISFLLPAARIGNGEPGGGPAAPGWAVAFDALALLFVSVKGAWLGFLPSLWTVLLNVFMLMVPVEIKAVEEGRGRAFALMFALGTAIPAVLAYVPGLFGLGIPLLAGFYVWELSMLAAATLFVRMVWGGTWSYMPAAIATVLLICMPIQRGEWKSAPEQPKQAAAAPRTLPREMPQSVQPTTIVIESTPNPSFNGEEVTFLARISVPWGQSLPGGTVRFNDVSGNKLIGSVHTSDGGAAVSTDQLSIGEHAIRASFVADPGASALGSDASVVQVVQRHPHGSP